MGLINSKAILGPQTSHEWESRQGLSRLFCSSYSDLGRAYFVGEQQDTENDTGSTALEGSPVNKTVLTGERIITDARPIDVHPDPATNFNPIKEKLQNFRSTKNISDEFKAGMDLILGTSY